MAVSVVCKQRHVGVAAVAVRRDARRVLAALGEARAEVTLSLVDDAQIRFLNRTFRGTDRPTDVLAFAMREGRRVAGDETILGDVVISLDTAARQAQRRRVPLSAEVRTLLIHGLLHLLGYDHERSAAQARRMHAMARRLRARLARAASRNRELRAGRARSR